jgi:hypothetical protein
LKRREVAISAAIWTRASVSDQPRQGSVMETAYFKLEGLSEDIETLLPMALQHHA